MKIILRLILLIFLTGCNNHSNPPNNNQNQSIDTTAFTRPLDVTSQQVILLPEAKETATDWLAYITAQTEIENFNNYTVKEVIANATPIAEIMQSLRETVPPEFKTNAVETRLSVLYTKAKVLERLANRRNSDPEKIKSTAEELPVEFNNFKIQLNELYLKTLEDFEEELDAFETEDTIRSTSGPDFTPVREQ